MTKLQKEFTNYMKIALKCDAIDFYRSQKAKRKYEVVSIENIEESKVSVSLNGETDTSFLADLDYEYENVDLKRAVSKLTEKRKRIFKLYIDGYSTKEIAQLEDITETNVVVTINKIKKFIKKEMEK